MAGLIPYWDNGPVQLYHADAREIPLPDQSVHCVVTSPPYLDLRVYQDNDDRGIGLEASVEAYIANLVGVFREVRRVLRDDGVCWVNLGDSYANDPGWGRGGGSTLEGGKKTLSAGNHLHGNVGVNQGNRLGIPERVVLALQADGWIWRDTVIWAKKSAMPESLGSWRWEQCRVKVKGQSDKARRDSFGEDANGRRAGVTEDWLAQWHPCPGCAKCASNDGLVLRKGSWRTTSSHEYIFMLTKGMGYYADGEAMKESRQGETHSRGIKRSPPIDAAGIGHEGWVSYMNHDEDIAARNRRSVWSDISPEPLLLDILGVRCKVSGHYGRKPKGRFIVDLAEVMGVPRELRDGFNDVLRWVLRYQGHDVYRLPADLIEWE